MKQENIDNTVGIAEPRPEPHADENQIELDTRRAFVTFPEDLAPAQRAVLQAELQEILVELFHRPTFRKLSYFQGLHDIVSVFYLTFLDYPWEDQETESAGDDTKQDEGKKGADTADVDDSTNRGRSAAPVKAESEASSPIGTPSSTSGTRSRSVSIKLSQHPGQITFLSVPSSSSTSCSAEVSRSDSTSASSSTQASRSSSRSAASRSRHRSISREPYRRQQSDTHTAQRAQLIDLLERVCLLRIRDALAPSLAPTVAHLRLLRRVIRAKDPAFARLIARTSPATPPFFALSWLLTLFSHDISSLSAISRVFDYLLARNPAAVAYLGAAVLMRKRSHAMELEKTLDDDPGVLHSYLASMPVLTEDDEENTLRSEKAVSRPSDGSYYPSTDDAILSGSSNTERIALSTLFQEADALWTRHPPWGPSIRVSELLGECSVVNTYVDDLDRSPAGETSGSARSGPHHAWTLEQAQQWVLSSTNENGIDEDAIVNRQPTDSDVEDEDTLEISYPPSKRPRRTKSLPFSRLRLAGLARLIRANRTALVILLLGVGWAYYLRSSSASSRQAALLGHPPAASIPWWRPRSLLWPFSNSHGGIPQVTWSDVLSRMRG